MLQSLGLGNLRMAVEMMELTNLLNDITTTVQDRVDSMPNAIKISDPEKFVTLTHKLLSIFPNGDRATQVLDPSTGNQNVSAEDAAVINEVVPELRKMLRNTPIEVERRSKRNRCAETAARIKRTLMSMFGDRLNVIQL